MSSFIHITNALIYDSERETDDIKQVILIDSQIRNHSEIVASVNSETFPILYSTTSERTDLLALLQNKFMKIERLGICFEMEPEKMFLNLEPFFTENECGPYSKNVRGLMEIMEEFSIAHLDFIFSESQTPTQDWKTYFNILSKEGQVGFENSPYFVADFPLQQYLKPTSKPWLSGFSLPCSMAVHGEHLYVANYGSSFVSRVTDFVSDVVSDAVDMEWKAFEEPAGLVVHGKYLYVSNYCEENGYISKVNLQTMEVQARWFEDLLGPAGITVWEDHLYICDTLDNKIVRVNIYNPHDTCCNWISLESPVSVVCYGGFIYVSCMREDCIYKICLKSSKFVDQWEIVNPVSMAVSQNGLMYISCLYDACSDTGNSIFVLNLVSGEFVENLDVSYNGVGSLMVHGGDLYMAEYLSFGLRKFALPLFVSEVDADEVSKIETWKEKEEYFREEMGWLEDQRKEREEKHREDLLTLELRLTEEYRKEQEEKHLEDLLDLEEIRAKDLWLLEEEKHREELRLLEELRLKEEEKHREELRLLEELRLRDLRELEEQRLVRELLEMRDKEMRDKEIHEKESWKDEIKKLIQQEFKHSHTQNSVEKPVETDHWKDEIKKLIINVIQSEISEIILPLKNYNVISAVETEIDTETLPEKVKSKFQTHFSTVAGFTYTGKPIEQKLTIFDKQIQKMGMKHF